MKRYLRAFVITIILFMVLAFAIHIKNYIQIGHFSTHIQKGDIWDKAFMGLSIPGFIVYFVLENIIWWPPHLHPIAPEWFCDGASLIGNFAFYGGVVCGIIWLANRRKRPK